MTTERRFARRRESSFEGDARDRAELTAGGSALQRPAHWLTRTGTALVLTIALLVVPVQLWSEPDPLAQVRADANAAVVDLHRGDLLALGTRLAAHRGNADFAYFFASQTSPRLLGDALGSVGGETGALLETGVDRHAYELALTDLAGTLALATHGAGDRALSSSWRESFISAMTSTESVVRRHGPQSSSGTRRADQDQANQQNLLLVLSRGYWSTGFLREATAAFWQHDRENGNGAWRSERIEGAKYALAPSGAYLTDGMVALTAALTANPVASEWAFSRFQPGSKVIEGTERSIGRLTHYLLFEHRYPESADGEAVGIAAVLTALSSAIRGESEVQGIPIAATYVQDFFDGAGPTHDSRVLESMAEEVKEDNRCSWSPVTYWNCAKVVASAVWRWVRHWGHRVLDILSFAPPPFGVAAASSNAAWYLIEGDYADAGLSLAAAVPTLAFVKIAKGAKTSKFVKVSERDRDLEKGASQSDDVASVSRKQQAAAKRVDDFNVAKEGAVRLVKSPRKAYAKESEAQDDLTNSRPGSVKEAPLDPRCRTSCDGKRRVDIYNAKTKVCIEVKTGAGITNYEFEVTQVAKDVRLRRKGICKIVEWHFLPDASGEVGPSGKHRALLKRNKIPFVMYLP